MNLLKLKRIVRYVLRNKLSVIDDLLLSKMIEERLLEFPKSSWPYFYSRFNSWEFPEPFYDLIPGWYNPKNNNHDRMMIVINRAFDRIQKEIGDKELLRNHNVKSCMTEEEFEFWYNRRWDITYLLEVHMPRSTKFKKIAYWNDDVWNKLKSAELVTE